MSIETSNYCENGLVVCRGCLATSGEMKNMFEWGLFKDFNIFADVSISRSEGVSELLCHSCEESLNHCRQFRQRCQRSDAWLREAAQNKETDQSNGEADGIRTTHHLTDHKLLIKITTPPDQMEREIYLPCPHSCPKSYIKRKDLLLHLKKSHLANENFEVDVQYHCPFAACSYNTTSEKKKHFTGRKNLNQHIKKAHRSKEIVCHTCHLTFSQDSDFVRHHATCNVTYVCALCNKEYRTNERLLVHLKRNHPTLHKQYKEQRKQQRGDSKRVSETVTCDSKRVKKHTEALRRDMSEYICVSPRRSFATQTLVPEDSIKNDVTLPSWGLKGEKSDDIDRNYSTIETQTVFEDLLSLRSQNSEDDSLFFSETVSLSDIQTQTFPVEFGLSRKETITSETQTRNQSPDLSIKETQTCLCLYDSPKLNFKLFDSVNSSPSSINLTSAETQTADMCKSTVKSDVLLSFNSTETQTCFEEGAEKDL